MSTASNGDAHTSPKAKGHRQERRSKSNTEEISSAETLTPIWVAFYFSSALTISWLYYHNPGFWELVKHARYWATWVKGTL